MTIKVTYNVTDVYVTQDVSPVYINVSYSTGSSGGSAVWGGITGTLSDQTDLQTALDLKVPYTGATTNVNLGEYEIKAGQVTLDTSPTGTAAVGTTRWNDTIGSSETTLKGGSVILKNGVDLVARVVNKVSPNTTLTKAAYQAVRVSGAQGQRLAVAFAQANNDNNSADTIGLVIETIATNQEGFIMTVGQIEGINTTGSLQGETWNDGDIIYLSPTIAGAVTNVKPSGGQHLVIIGYVEYAHANNGRLYIKISNGWELTELHDVDVTSPANNEALIYESSSALWKNKTIATALGYTPANAATTLTINGVSYDLSANRTWSVGSVTGSGASGQVSYWDGTTSQAGSNNLFWDATNSRLGIGTNAPAAAYKLDVVGAIRASTYLLSPAFYASSDLLFGISGGTGAMRITTNRNLQIFDSVTPADSGERLQVTGTMKVTGLSTFGESLTISKNSNAVLGLIISNTTAGTGSNPYLQLVSDATAGSAQVFKYSSTRTPYKTIAASDFGHYNATAGDISFLNDFASGAIKFAAGGSSTAHMTIKSNGRINMSSLPTSSTGLATGDLWNDAGTIKIV